MLFFCGLSGFVKVSEGTCECLGGLCEVLFGSVRVSVRACVVLGGYAGICDYSLEVLCVRL